MCARHEIDDAVIREAVSKAETHNPEVYSLPSGIVRPRDPSLVIAGHQGHLHAGIMHWGLPRYDGKGLIINTRSETALDKQIFRESMMERRCVIPAKAFYEWDRQKQMVTFQLPNREILWMAGIFDAAHRYSVLTTGANDSVRRFHDRMPLLLTGDELESWLLDPTRTRKLLEKEIPMLEHRQEQEQISLFE